jgi:hypothetical protein
MSKGKKAIHTPTIVLYQKNHLQEVRGHTESIALTRMCMYWF